MRPDTRKGCYRNENGDELCQAHPLSIGGTGHSTSVDIDQSRHSNSWGPWVTAIAIIASLSLGMSIVIIPLLASDIKELKTQYRLVDDDWQKQTAWLYAHGVARDSQGNLYIVEKP